MSQVLRINSVKGNGEQHVEAVDIPIRNGETGQYYLAESGEPSVVVTGLPMSYTEWQRRLRGPKYTKKVANKDTHRMEEQTDLEAAMLDLVKERVTGWRGFVGADNLPLVCNADTLAELHLNLRAQIVNGLVGAAATEVAEASFFPTA